VLDSIQHEKLPLTVTLLNLELFAIQTLHQFENQRGTDVRMLFLVMGINHYLTNPTPIYDKIHGVSGALEPHETILVYVAIFGKSLHLRMLFEMEPMIGVIKAKTLLISQIPRIW
jgi:hypothetical protein